MLARNETSRLVRNILSDSLSEKIARGGGFGFLLFLLEDFESSFKFPG